MNKFIKLTKGAARCAVAAFVFCVAGVLHADISHSYITNGLAVWYDGIDNAGKGVHSSLAEGAEWADLTGNGNGGTILKTLTWGDTGWINASDGAPIRIETSVVRDAMLTRNFTIDFAVTPSRSDKRQAFYSHWQNNLGTSIEHNAGGVSSGAVRTYFCDNPNWISGVTVTKDEKATISLVATLTERNLFKNGILAGTQTKSITASDNEISPTDRPSIVGGDPGRPSFAFYGTYHAFRCYTRVLTADEVAVNAASDRVRLLDASISDVTLPDGYMMNANSNVLFRVTATAPEGEGTVSMDGGEAAQEVTSGYALLNNATNITLTATPAAGMDFAYWSGDTWAITSGSATSPTITVSAERRVELYAVFDARTVTPGDISHSYITNGLAVWFDGVDNVGKGFHSANPSVWADLTGNGNNGTIVKTDLTWGDTGWVNSTDGTPIQIETSVVHDAMKTKSFTIEFATTPSRSNVRQAFYSHWNSNKTGVSIEHNSGSVSSGAIRPFFKWLPDWTSDVTVTADENATISFVADQEEEMMSLFKNGSLAGTKAEAITETEADIAAGNASIVGGDPERSNFAFYGTYHAFRCYDRVLSASEVAVNAASDSVRLLGEDVADVELPDGYKFDENAKVLFCISAAVVDGEGAVSMDGGEAAQEVTSGYTLLNNVTNVTLTAVPANGMEFAGWSGDTWAITFGDATSPTIKVSAERRAKLTAVFAAPVIWTGEAGDGDPENANNWKDSITNDAVVPAAKNTVKIQGTNVNLQWPYGKEITCKAIEIGDCTFAADCDWTGLPVTPSLVGAVDLAGFDLKLSGLSVVQGGGFDNSGSDESSVAFKVPDGDFSDFNETLYVTGMADLALGDNVTLQLAKTGEGTLNSTNFKLGQSATPVEMVQTDGTVSLSSDRVYIGATSDNTANATYLMKGGTLESSIDFDIGAYGHGEFVQTGGSVQLSSWLTTGRRGGSSCSGVLTVNGGTFTNSYEKPVYNAAEGSTGTINVGGDGVVTFYQLNCSGHDDTASTSYLNISGNGVLSTVNWATLYGRSGGYAEANQSGGTFNCGQDFTVGENGSAAYNMSDGVLNIARDMYIGRHTKAVAIHTLTDGAVTIGGNFQIGANGRGTLTQSGGTVQCDGYLSVGRLATAGVGTYTMTGGTYLSSKCNGIIGEDGTGTMEIGGTATANFTNGLELARAASATGTLIVAQSGVLNASYIKKTGSGLANVIFDGGTVVVTNVADGAAFITGIDDLRIRSGGTVIDTAGHNVSISNCGYVEFSGSSLTKTGEGTLTFDELPPASTLTVSEGAIGLSADNDNAAAASLTHRWSFTDGSLVDSIGNVTATTLPTNNPALTFENNAVAMTGNGHNTGSLNLGTGLVDSGDVTIEIWATRTAHKDWSRVFDFGSDTSNYLLMTWGNDHRVALVQNGSDKIVKNTFAFENGVTNHISMTIKANADGSSTISWAQRNVETGNIVNSGSFTQANWSIMELASKTFLLGRSLCGNLDANAIYDEVRIWRGALSEESLTQSAINGPDATTEQIAAVANMTTEILDGRTLEIAEGATLSLGGYTLTQQNLTGNGTIANGILKVTGTLKVTVGDCLTLAEGTVLDLSDATVEILDLENLTRGFTFVRGGTIIGTPTVKNLPKGWRLAIGRTARIARNVFSIIVR